MSFDLTGVSKSIPMVDLWFQGNYGMESLDATFPDSSVSWMGFGIQPLVHLTEKFGVGLRYEYFMDDGLSRVGLAGFALPPTATATDLTIQNFTITPTLWLTKNLMTRAEFRMDMASEKVFSDDKNLPSDSQMQIAADVVGSF